MEPRAGASGWAAIKGGPEIVGRGRVIDVRSRADRASDLVTVSWCRFSRHDKTMLIGGNDRHEDDERPAFEPPPIADRLSAAEVASRVRAGAGSGHTQW